MIGNGLGAKGNAQNNFGMMRDNRQYSPNQGVGVGINSEANGSSFYSNNTSVVSGNLSNSRYLGQNRPGN